MVKSTKLVQSNLSLSTYVQYVEDFKLWVKVAGPAPRVPEKFAVICEWAQASHVSWRISSRACDTLQEVIDEVHDEQATYNEILEINERAKKTDVKSLLQQQQLTCISGRQVNPNPQFINVSLL
jgi:hypothetical protein